MTVKVEALRALNSWQEVDYDSVPFMIKSNLSEAETSYIVAENEDGVGTLVYTFSPVKGEHAKAAIKTSGVLYDISVEFLQPGDSKLLEGVVPGGTKSELLKLTEI